MMGCGGEASTRKGWDMLFIYLYKYLSKVNLRFRGVKMGADKN